MKYNKKIYTNLISVLLVLCFVLSLGACSNDGGSGYVLSDYSDVISNSEPVPEMGFTLETAQQLIENDKRVTEIFVSNSLCDDTMKTRAEYFELSEGNEFCSFLAIENLLGSTYLQQSGEIDFYLSYPFKDVPSVRNQNGKTAVFYHNGIGYTDFVDITTIEIVDTEKSTEKLIKAKTLSGKSVELKAVYSNESWLLERGIFKVNPVISDSLDVKLPLSDLGSASNFTGEILVIELFISDRESTFEKADERLFHEKISKAVDFIAEESEKNGNEVNITYEKMYFDHENALENEVIYLDIMLAETGFGTLEEFAKESFNIYQYNNYFFVVCLNKDFDSSVGVYDGTVDTEFYRAERAVVGKDFSETKLCASVLEIFGNPGFNDYLGELYKAYFPNAVENVDLLENAMISPITAYACGFLEDVLSVYRIFFN